MVVATVPRRSLLGCSVSVDPQRTHVSTLLSREMCRGRRLPVGATRAINYAARRRDIIYRTRARRVTRPVFPVVACNCHQLCRGSGHEFPAPICQHTRKSRERLRILIRSSFIDRTPSCHDTGDVSRLHGVSKLTSRCRFRAFARISTRILRLYDCGNEKRSQRVEIAFAKSSCAMIKFKWLRDKILWQRVLLLTIGGGIAREILTGYVDYNNKVVEYMQSVSYRQARDTYSRMRSNQHLFSLHTAESPAGYQDAASTERIANE